MKSVELDLTQDPVAGERSERVKIHIKPVPTEDGAFAALLPHGEILQREGERVGIHAYLANRDGAPECGRSVFLQL